MLHWISSTYSKRLLIWKDEQETGGGPGGPTRKQNETVAGDWKRPVKALVGCYRPLAQPEGHWLGGMRLNNKQLMIELAMPVAFMLMAAYVIVKLSLIHIYLERLSNHEAPKSVTFIQCVGSRDLTCKGKTYCSKICCMYTAKHAMLIRDKYPDVEVNVFYIDVRTPGKNFDEFYRRAVEEYGVNYIKGQVGKVAEVGGQLRVQAVD